MGEQKARTILGTGPQNLRESLRPASRPGQPRTQRRCRCSGRRSAAGAGERASTRSRHGESRIERSLAASA
eukprot:4597704-Pyramimonas_sp.AAC.1